MKKKQSILLIILSSALGAIISSALTKQWYIIPFGGLTAWWVIAELRTIHNIKRKNLSDTSKGLKCSD
jgi:hypothetical protein